MFCCTFYSYKGGVGRSLALMNVACHLAGKGANVCLIDFDLEAPGLSTFSIFLKGGKNKIKKGLSDYLSSYQESYPNFNFPDMSEFIVEANKFKIGDLNFDKKENYGKIYLLPSGDYKEINFSDLYLKQEGYKLFEELKLQISKYTNADFILIDSRTGESDQLSICTQQLPNIIVYVFFPNEQNLVGIKKIKDLVDPKNDYFENGKAIYVASRLPNGDDEEQILEVSLQKAESKLSVSSDKFIKLPHNDNFSLLEQELFALTKNQNNSLNKMYIKLAENIEMLSEKWKYGVLNFFNELSVGYNSDNSNLKYNNNYIVSRWKNGIELMGHTSSMNFIFREILNRKIPIDFEDDVLTGDRLFWHNQLWMRLSQKIIPEEIIDLIRHINVSDTFEVGDLGWNFSMTLENTFAKVYPKSGFPWSLRNILDLNHDYFPSFSNIIYYGCKFILFNWDKVDRYTRVNHFTNRSFLRFVSYYLYFLIHYKACHFALDEENFYVFQFTDKNSPPIGIEKEKFHFKISDKASANKKLEEQHKKERQFLENNLSSLSKKIVNIDPQIFKSDVYTFFKDMPKQGMENEEEALKELDILLEEIVNNRNIEHRDLVLSTNVDKVSSDFYHRNIKKHKHEGRLIRYLNIDPTGYEKVSIDLEIFEKFSRLIHFFIMDCDQQSVEDMIPNDADSSQFTDCFYIYTLFATKKNISPLLMLVLLSSIKILDTFHQDIFELYQKINILGKTIMNRDELDKYFKDYLEKLEINQIFKSIFGFETINIDDFKKEFNDILNNGFYEYKSKFEKILTYKLQITDILE